MQPNEILRMSRRLCWNGAELLLCPRAGVHLDFTLFQGKWTLSHWTMAVMQMRLAKGFNYSSWGHETFEGQARFTLVFDVACHMAGERLMKIAVEAGLIALDVLFDFERDDSSHDFDRDGTALSVCVGVRDTFSTSYGLGLDVCAYNCAALGFKTIEPLLADGPMSIPTLDEVLTLANAEEARLRASAAKLRALVDKYSGQLRPSQERLLTKHLSDWSRATVGPVRYQFHLARITLEPQDEAELDEAEQPTT